MVNCTLCPSKQVTSYSSFLPLPFSLFFLCWVYFTLIPYVFSYSDSHFSDLLYLKWLICARWGYPMDTSWNHLFAISKRQRYPFAKSSHIITYKTLQASAYWVHWFWGWSHPGNQIFSLSWIIDFAFISPLPMLHFRKHPAQFETCSTRFLGSRNGTYRWHHIYGVERNNSCWSFWNLCYLKAVLIPTELWEQALGRRFLCPSGR